LWDTHISSPVRGSVAQLGGRNQIQEEGLNSQPGSAQEQAGRGLTELCREAAPFSHLLSFHHTDQQQFF